MTEAQELSFLFVGLGNPGEEYSHTRHNLGYRVVQELGRCLECKFKEDRRFNAKVAKGVKEKRTVHLVLPLTYMNLSGTAVRRYVDYYKIPLQNVLIVTDDISLPFGQLRLRSMGSSGGHNGLKSIEAHLGTSRYLRLRMGIGHPGERMLTDFVLDAFDPVEREELPNFIEQGMKVLLRVLNESFSCVMNSVNTVPNKVETIDLTKPPFTGQEKA